MKICIVGGSTAGWWAAGYLEKNMPECEIVLYDSPDIPNLGVGESTLPQIKTWFDDIGIKEENWFDKCNAVKKYGNYKQGWNTPPIGIKIKLQRNKIFMMFLKQIMIMLIIFVQSHLEKC